MPEAPDDRTVSQADFDRLAETSRDAWRKWERRAFVSKPRGRYAWIHVLQGLVLSRLERVAGHDVIVQCWDDVRDELVSSIHPSILDVIVDPGTSDASKPRLRAHVSTRDDTTAQLARAAERPVVIPLAAAIAQAREEFDRTVERRLEHADPVATKGKSVV